MGRSGFPRNFVWCNFFNSYGFEILFFLESCRGSSRLLLCVCFPLAGSKYASMCAGRADFYAFLCANSRNVIKIVAQHLPLSYCVWIWGAKGKDHKFHSVQCHCATLRSDSLCRRMSAMLPIDSSLEFHQFRDRNGFSRLDLVRAHLESRNLRFSHDLARQKLPCSEIPESDEQKNFESNRRAKKLWIQSAFRRSRHLTAL